MPKDPLHIVVVYKDVNCHSCYVLIIIIMINITLMAIYEHLMFIECLSKIH